MGLRDKADRIKGVAASLGELRDSGKLAELKDAAAAVGDRVKDSDLGALDVVGIATTAASSAGVLNADGKLSKWRMARAAATPRATASRVVKAVGAEVVRQAAQDDQATTLDDSSEDSPAAP